MNNQNEKYYSSEEVEELKAQSFKEGYMAARRDYLHELFHSDLNERITLTNEQLQGFKWYCYEQGKKDAQKKVDQSLDSLHNIVKELLQNEK